MNPFPPHISGTSEAYGGTPHSNRTVLGSLPLANWSNYSSHEYMRHESPLHASAEALLLLNNAQFNHATFANSTPLSTGKENASVQDVGVPITAPVPLSYAVRGKAALRSILSIGEQDEEEENENDGDGDSTFQKLNEPVIAEGSHAFKEASSNTLPEIEITAPTPGPILPIFPNFDLRQELTLVTDQQWPAVNETQSTRPFIRSISPSTLMALTEPCLMAWCFDPDLDLNNETPQYATTSTQASDLSCVPAVYDAPANYVMPTTRNLWGY